MRCQPDIGLGAWRVPRVKLRRTIEVVEGEWPPFERCLGEVSGHLSSKGLEMGPDHLNDCRPDSHPVSEARING